MDSIERTRRDVKSFLNKLTVEKIAVISERIALVVEGKPECLQEVVNLVLDKAVTEPAFSEMYADLCQILQWRSPCHGNKNEFTNALLNRCQVEFETMPTTFVLSPEDTKNLTQEDIDNKILKMKTRILGVAKLIGELFIRKMLGVKILSSVVHDLLFNKENPEDHFIESMCELIMATGYHLDSHERGRGQLDQWEARLMELKTHGDYSSRVQFLIQDVFETRNVKWVKKIHKEKAKTLCQIKDDMDRAEMIGGTIHVAQHGTIIVMGQRSNLDGDYAEYMRAQEEQYAASK